MRIPNAESWRDLPGWEGLYQASDHGRIRSLDRIIKHPRGNRRRGGVVLRPFLAGGYEKVYLCRDGTRTAAFVHALVAATFVGPRPPGHEVCHQNGHRRDNRASNLRFGTPSDNALDRVRHGTHNEAAKTQCPRGHRLIPVNLRSDQVRKGKRTCLACDRARSRLRRQAPSPARLQAVSDEIYRDITERNAA
ncbi:NUMOD4 motif-containing HNH endonuclease [Nocardia puris]|uniref:NUMOD4 motif-containing protein n=1 Tax=Nocardia puris TaxID=208602 RepID=A0A366DMN8_9NOCA|nr:NUMOD4 motif-containing HNH endonuclease [Nocardia puris]RBO91367.1 NUMOD4 motif-containing protein [Nocardia puris]